MQFESSKEEKEFDTACSAWLAKYRKPNTQDLALVMERAASIGGHPCVSLFERAYRELFAEGFVKLTTEKLVEPTVIKPEVLTAEEYQRIPASTVTRKYMTDRGFKAQVDALIARREI